MPLCGLVLRSDGFWGYQRGSVGIGRCLCVSGVSIALGRVSLSWGGVKELIGETF